MSIEPSNILFHQQSGNLSLSWGEDTFLLTGKELRNACQCASCRALDSQGQFHPANDIKIIEVNPFGVAGLQLVFSDQHSRGVYPWAYLKALASV